MRIAMELLCAAADANILEIGRSMARMTLAAVMATISADCPYLRGDDSWTLFFRPATLWHFVSIAHDTAERIPLAEGAGAKERADSQKLARSWFSTAWARASERSSLKWDGPELAVCPVQLEHGATLNCHGLALSSANRYVQIRRGFLRSCMSALRYGFEATGQRAGCKRRTLVMLPHADLVGHLINGVQWFLALVRAIFQDQRSRSNVTLAVIDHGWISEGLGPARFATSHYESRAKPGLFLKLLQDLSDEPVLFLSQLVQDAGASCTSVCFTRAVWGFPQLHAHSLEHLEHRPGVAVYKEAMLFWKGASVSLQRALSTDQFRPRPGLRLSPRSAGAAGSGPVLRILLIQRVNTRRLADLDGLIDQLESDILDHGFVPRVVVAGENGTSAWQQLPALDQIALARQADIMIGPSGNELGLGAFMREETWLVELMPQAVVDPSKRTQPLVRYEVTNCVEHVNGNPGSLVGHVAVRAHLYHLCMNVNRGRIFEVQELESPHWRFTPRLHVDLNAFREMMALPLSVIQAGVGYLAHNRKQVCPEFGCGVLAETSARDEALLVRKVTSIWIAVERPGGVDWSLDEVSPKMDSSPFKDGTLVVVCCANESLNPNLNGLLPAPAKLHTRLSDAAQSLKMWKSAKSRMMATMALSRAASVFGKRNSDRSDESSLWDRSTQSDHQAIAGQSARETSGTGSLTLKSAIKKDAAKKKLRFDIEGAEAELPLTDLLPPVSADPEAADFNKPKTPWLLQHPTDAEPLGDNAMSRGTQTEPMAKATSRRCCRCGPCGTWVDEDEETEVWLTT
ncbi:unnamed protein product [Symbiodinium natans]|uniref:Uncharacterized protein n=1 Tax=Symbiodinium natans TaxID=878477 RepID=A0A812KUN7_9DINO|nr:unnamed protein product [Symbiodinium natans]